LSVSHCAWRRLPPSPNARSYASENRRWSWLCATYPDFAALYLSHLLTRNIRLEEDLVDQLFNSSEKRLARVLLLLADLGKDGKPEAVIAKISQESLAEMIGTTRSRVSFFMNKFRKLGFVAYNSGAQLAAHCPPPRLTGRSPCRQRAPRFRQKFFSKVSNFDGTRSPGTLISVNANVRAASGC
jgi:hypothetical protein